MRRHSDSEKLDSIVKPILDRQEPKWNPKMKPSGGGIQEDKYEEGAELPKGDTTKDCLHIQNPIVPVDTQFRHHKTGEPMKRIQNQGKAGWAC